MKFFLKNKLFLLIPACLIFVALLIVTAPGTKADSASGYYNYAVNTDDGTKCTITGYTGSGGDITIPDTLTDGTNTYTVSAIGDKAFYDNTDITSVVIPDNVTIIGKQAFFSCYSLASIELPKSLLSIGDMAFSICSSLKDPVLPENLLDLGAAAFSDCTSITNINIPEKITELPVSLFQHCTSLQNITLPNAVTSIDNNAFNECTSMSSITIPNNVETINKGAFRGCSLLNNIIIPNKVTKIAEFAFCNCTSLTDITLSDNLVSIGQQAFQNCIALKSIRLPEGINIIGQYAFETCTAMNYICFPDSVSNFAYGAFEDCTHLKAVYFEGNAPTCFSNNVFYHCASGFTIYHKDSSTGFTNTWNGYPTAVFNTQHVSFDMNGATNTPPETQTIYTGQQAVCPAEQLRNGYTLVGWYTEDSCQNKWDFDAPVMHEMVLFAKWASNTNTTILSNLHTVTFNFNNGNSASTDTVNFGEHISSPLDPEKTGYKFNSWYNADTEWKFETDTMPDSDLTLDATWTPITYTIKYNINGGESGNMGDSTFTYDQSAELRQNTFAKSGYAFAGWAIEAEGEIIYTDEQSVNNLADTQDAEVNLFAVWISRTPSAKGTFTQYLPSFNGATFWHFDRPNQIVADIYGNIYVADTYDSCVQKLNSNGELISKWGTLGTGDGEFDFLTGIALDASGNVYTADTLNVYTAAEGTKVTCRVQVFDPNGNFIKKWTFNVDENKTAYCYCIAVDKQGNVYVTGNGSVFKFDYEGNLLKSWGGAWSVGSGGAMGIAADSNGYIYVTNGYDSIGKFDSDGNLILKWGSLGNGNGKFQEAYGVAVDNLGYVYVTNADIGEVKTAAVQKFDSNGNYIQSYARKGTPMMDNVYAVAPDNFGNLYVGEAVSICKYATNGRFLSRWTSVSNSNSSFNGTWDVVFDSSENMYVLDAFNCRIQKFDKNGKFISKWNTRRSNERDAYPTAIAISSDNRIYIAMSMYQKVDIYDTNGRFIRSAPLQDCGYWDYQGARGMDFGADGTLYVANYWSIQVYTKDMQYLRSLLKCNEVPRFDPRGVAVGPDGNLYITNRDNKLIVYDKDGNFIKKWDIGDSSIIPEGIDLDSNGNVYVADTDCNMIIEFDNDGNMLYRWGGKGVGNNQFNVPFGVKLDSYGNIFVADTGNNRIMRMPANSGDIPEINYMSIKTSPSLGYTLGGSNTMSINIGVSTESDANLTAYVFNSKGKWVAQITATADKSGEYKFDWDGKATAGNTAKITAGKQVPSSSGGTSYKIRACVENGAGSSWSTIQTIKFYSSSKVKWVGLTSQKITNGQTTTFKYRVEHFSNVEVQIIDSKGRIAAKYNYGAMFPNIDISTTWDGCATEGNGLGLSAGSAVAPGVYNIKIITGNTVYTATKKITVY